MNFIDKIKLRLKNCFICIVIKNNSYHTKCVIYSNGKISFTEDKSFEIAHKGEMPINFSRYIETYRTKYRFFYVSYIFGGVSQGMIPKSDYESFRKFNLDPANLDIVKYNKDNSIYASSSDIDTIVEQFHEVGGVDMIYSPFVILEEFIKKESIDSCTLYLVSFDEFIAISIHNPKDTLFGVFFKTGSSEGIVDDSSKSQSGGFDDELIEEDDDVNDLISLDDIDDVDDIDDIGSIDDMGSLDDGDGFEGFEGDESESEDMDSLEKNEREAEDIGRDIIMLKYLKSSIEEFYKNDIYKSDFLEKIKIYESSPISKEIIDYIENDLLLPLEISKISILDEAVKLSFDEVYGG